jgi:hypothetical protein
MADVIGVVAQVREVNTPSILTATGGLSANSRRGGWSVQNVGTNPLFIRLGGTASDTVFHYILKGGTGDSDGLGAMVSQTAGTVFTGQISVTGTSPKYVVMEL